MGQVTIPMQPGFGAGYVQAMDLLNHIRRTYPDHRAVVHVDGKRWAITICSDTWADDQLSDFYRPAVYISVLP